MATTGFIGCSPEFGSLPGSFDRETLNLFDDDIISTSVFQEIVGSAEAVCRVIAQVLRVALSNATVLITGQGGTGKELLARAIHGRSNCSCLPFVCTGVLVMETG
jgi:DNA-binding NtrC family response regulator